MITRRLLVLFFVLLSLACGTDDVEPFRQQVVGGDGERGRRMITEYGCGACHSISGVPGAAGLVGPPLDDIAERTHLAGRIPNTPENILLWIQDPKSVDRRTLMPDVNVSEQDARDIAAYLYSLRE